MKAEEIGAKYGWLIGLILNALILAYFVGGMRADVASMADRLSRVERIMDQASANATAAATAAAAAAIAAAASVKRQ